jgi:hypothetical protein
VRAASARRHAIGQAEAVANLAFSLCAAVAALLIAVLSAVKGQVFVAAVFGLLFVGFLLRAREGHRRRDRE